MVHTKYSATRFYSCLDFPLKIAIYYYWVNLTCFGAKPPNPKCHWDHNQQTGHAHKAGCTAASSHVCGGVRPSSGESSWGPMAQVRGVYQGGFMVGKPLAM